MSDTKCKQILLYFLFYSNNSLSLFLQKPRKQDNVHQIQRNDYFIRAIKLSLSPSFNLWPISTERNYILVHYYFIVLHCKNVYMDKLVTEYTKRCHKSTSNYDCYYIKSKLLLCRYLIVLARSFTFYRFSYIFAQKSKQIFLLKKIFRAYLVYCQTIAKQKLISNEYVNKTENFLLVEITLFHLYVVYYFKAFWNERGRYYLWFVCWQK